MSVTVKGVSKPCVCVLSCVRPIVTPLRPARLLCPWNVSGNNTAAACDFLPQGVFSTTGLNPCLLNLLYCKWILLSLRYLGSPAVLL